MGGRRKSHHRQDRQDRETKASYSKGSDQDEGINRTCARRALWGLDYWRRNTRSQKPRCTNESHRRRPGVPLPIRCVLSQTLHRKRLFAATCMCTSLSSTSIYLTKFAVFHDGDVTMKRHPHRPFSERHNIRRYQYTIRHRQLPEDKRLPAQRTNYTDMYKA